VLITRMITDRIGLHSVLLPLLILIIIIINYYYLKTAVLPDLNVGQPIGQYRDLNKVFTNLHGVTHYSSFPLVSKLEKLSF